MAPSLGSSPREQHERYVRTYFEGCNDASAEKMLSVCSPDAIHYFPPGMFGPVIGGQAIADLWIGMVRRFGSRWTIDRMISSDEAVAIEWTHFQPAVDTWIRGAEWYEFGEDGRITIIKAYYASPRDHTRPHNELDGYPYAGLGYPVEPPDRAPSLGPAG
jgi:SnoaL-like domain